MMRMIFTTGVRFSGSSLLLLCLAVSVSLPFSQAVASTAPALQTNDATGVALSSTQDDEPAAWLRKMSDALRSQNYDGIFTYMRGSTFDTVRIVHASVDGNEVERLFNMNGEVRELFRENDEARCYHPKHADGDPLSVHDHSVQIGPFSPAFSDRVLASRNLYRLSLHGEDRIAGRAAIKLAISPGNNDRYGYRIWLDEETGLLLQSHLIDRGNVKEVFQFTSLTVGEEIAETQLASSISGETVSHPLTFDSGERMEKPVLRVNWLPDGFRPVRVRGNRLHFSDGLATFSVFVEKADAAALPDMVTTMGGTVVITRRLKDSGPQITVVGEVPVQTAKRVAESVEPVVY